MVVESKPAFCWCPLNQMSLVHLLEPSRKSFLLSTDELCFLKIMVFPLLFIDIIIAFAMFERIIIRTLEEDRPELKPKFASLWPENSQAIQFSSVQLSLPEKAMAPHSSTLAWKIPWTEEPGRLQSMGFRRVGHDWATSLSLFTFMHWRRKWQPTPVFLPGESQGQGSLVGCRLWGRTESDTTEAT